MDQPKRPKYLLAKKTIEIDEHDACVVRHALAQRLKTVQTELSVLSIAKERDLTQEERWMLPANLQQLTLEELRDQIDPWESLRLTILSLMAEFRVEYTI